MGHEFRYPKITHISIALLLPDDSTPSNCFIPWGCSQRAEVYTRSEVITVTYNFELAEVVALSLPG
jgi:hypothetical protein